MTEAGARLSATTAVVIGTGRMAPGIASALAAGGVRVRLVGRSRRRATEAAAGLGAGVEASQLEPSAFAGAELVVETILEDPAAKAELFARIDPWLPERSVLATNTSGLSIDELARGLSRPESFAGLHFLYPADVTAVVEVIAGARTAPPTLAALAEVVEAMGKTPIVVKRDVPGFVWNRLQLALLREALWLLENDVADLDAIETALSDGLAPRWLTSGPFATADLGGTSTWARVAAEVFPHLSVETTVASALAARGDAGETFYDWDDESLQELTRLRLQNLEQSRQIAAERRRLTPRYSEQASGPAPQPHIEGEVLCESSEE